MVTGLTTITLGILPNNVKIFDYWYMNSGYRNKSGYVESNTNYVFNVDISPDGLLRLKVGNSLSITDLNILIEYTKTTD